MPHAVYQQSGSDLLSPPANLHVKQILLLDYSKRGNSEGAKNRISRMVLSTTLEICVARIVHAIEG